LWSSKADADVALLAYVAGFFDGEGSIGIYRNGQGTFYLRTQLTQNITPDSQLLLEQLRATFGGNLSFMRARVYRGGAAYNWQLNGNLAARFLCAIPPYLRLERRQAEVAIEWQSGHLPPGRDSRGRMLAHPKDLAAASLLKQLKSEPIDAVMAAQADLTEPVHTLKQIVVVKG
jgi:hypothetical protein